MVERAFFAFSNDILIDTTTGVGIINNSSTPVGREFVFNSDGFENKFVKLEDTSGDEDIFEDDQPDGHVITEGAGIVDVGANVEAESIHQIRQIDSDGNFVGPVINVTVFSQGGDFEDVWGVAFDSPPTNGASYQKVDGTNAGTSTYEDFAVCFAQGTRLRTPDGPRAVESLSPGDMVWTTDGPAPVRWVGSKTVAATGALAPIAFAPDSIGNDQRLVVSPQHRVLVRSPEVALMFGEDEMLVPAKHLLGMDGVSTVSGGTVTYWHVMFDAHRIVCSEGALTESFFPGDYALNSLEKNTLDEVLDLFPELAHETDSYGPTAAPCLRAHEARALIGARA